MTAEHSYSLEALQRRWQSEKTPQVGLRLAEEYRRKGDLEASIEALSAGLEVYPTHTATRVALSRYLVDGERFDDAVPHLEQIVALDPTHLVANKLLVGAYAGTGRLADARDKLDIYEMMGEGDADIERLHQLLSAQQQKESAPPASVADVEDVPEAAEPDGAAIGRAASEPAAPVTAATSRALDFEPAPGPELFPAAASTEVEDEPEPKPAPAAPVAPAAPEAPPVSPSLDAATPEPAGARVLDDLFARTAEEEPFGSAFEADSSSHYWQEAADDIFALGPTADESAVAKVEEKSPAPPSAPPSELAVDSTVTIGRLYREQGHREEAAAVFKDVLAREPDNEAARRELEDRAPEAATDDTGSTREASVAEANGLADALERKRSTLTAYLAQIRRAVAAGI